MIRVLSEKGRNTMRIAASERRKRTMSITAIGSAQATPPGGERPEGPGPDHDGDADDAGTALPASGIGIFVDKKA